MIGTYLDFDIGPADVVDRRFLQVSLIKGIIGLNHLICVIIVVLIIFFIFLVLGSLRAPRRVVLIFI